MSVTLLCCKVLGQQVLSGMARHQGISWCVSTLLQIHNNGNRKRPVIVTVLCRGSMTLVLQPIVTFQS